MLAELVLLLAEMVMSFLLLAEVLKSVLLLAEAVEVAFLLAVLLLVNGEDGLIVGISSVAIGRCWWSWWY